MYELYVDFFWKLVANYPRFTLSAITVDYNLWSSPQPRTVAYPFRNSPRQPHISYHDNRLRRPLRLRASRRLSRPRRGRAWLSPPLSLEDVIGLGVVVTEDQHYTDLLDPATYPDSTSFFRWKARVLGFSSPTSLPSSFMRAVHDGAPRASSSVLRGWLKGS